MFSKASEYGIKAAILISNNSLVSEEKIGVKQIAEEIDSPEAFTAKILQTLTKSNIINSSKGPYGGFYIPKDRLNEIKLSQIVSAIDGDRIFTGCALGLTQCNANKPCPLHNDFIDIRNQLSEMMIKTSLLDLANGLDSGLTFLKR
ncbi:RrF2 family transcriptional regulator [Brumimicrobium aurantiacum]|uniref:Rrf2 family transcriptional regulator n=1 Tax=Brumimicrobium aurantiacum TaxID=1737063 RepID=A0A3E1EYB5_9FLAO|nr:Rrf2 family transcriptional regulator [Brumimicrobium aurantiacum]RFC54542.1 Rrf2 family transcriptional regulator [Brumimicrobium aurantiacum]